MVETVDNCISIVAPIKIDNHNGSQHASICSLSFIYTDAAVLDPRTVLPLMHAAKKYELPKLIRACQRVLQDDLSTDNACAILDQARTILYFILNKFKGIVS